MIGSMHDSSTSQSYWPPADDAISDEEQNEDEKGRPAAERDEVLHSKVTLREHGVHFAVVVAAISAEARCAAAQGKKRVSGFQGEKERENTNRHVGEFVGRVGSSVCLWAHMQKGLVVSWG